MHQATYQHTINEPMQRYSIHAFDQSFRPLGREKLTGSYGPFLQSVKALSEKLQNIRSSVAPRSRFAFKSRKPLLVNTPSGAVDHARQQPADAPERPSPISQGPGSSGETAPSQLLKGARGPLLSQEISAPASASSNTIIHSAGSSVAHQESLTPGGLTISGRIASRIIFSASELHETSSGTISNLHRCVVDISQGATDNKPFANLTLKTIDSSLVACGQVSGPIHLTGVVKSVLVVSCRQFRMHDCRNVDVYLHCASRPIIEDCEGIRFAPLPEPFVCSSVPSL
jgi:tubulin-specific chaperone C